MIRTRPKLEDFGIPPSIQVSSLNSLISAHERKKDKSYSIFVLSIHSPLIFWSSYYYIVHRSFLNSIVPIALAFVLYWGWNFRSFYKWIFRRLVLPKVPCHPDVAKYADGLVRYSIALEDWEYLNLETGQGFWRTLRGENFENALARLFERRGLPVTKTKKTGDGGVDLILNASNETFFIQCKGYAKPIPVAPIREIAGVCSNSRARPIVAAVNGFTKGAQDCAKELGVILIDTPRIVWLAAQDQIQTNQL